MIDNTNYLKYLRLKNGLCVKHRGYDLKYAMSPVFVFFSYNLRKDKLKKPFIKRCLFYNVDLSEFMKQIKNENVIFTNSLPGLDHESLVSSVIMNVEEGFLFNDKQEIRIKINFSNIFSSFWDILLNKTYIDLPFVQKVYFALNLVYFKNLIDNLEKIPKFIKTKAYVACFSGNNESVFTEFFKKHNVKTYCLQHGMLTALSDYDFYIPPDIVSAENFNADFMLGWGYYTKKVLVELGYMEHAFLLAGNPKYSKNNIVEMKVSSFKKCIICLARDLYFDGNVRLLEIANGLCQEGIEVFLKFHPRSDMNKYKLPLTNGNISVLPLNSNIEESIKLVDPGFVIVFNSTVYYEYYLQGIVVFRYVFNTNEIPVSLNDSFMNLNELMKRIEEFRDKGLYEFSKEVNLFIDHIFGLGVNNYREILK